MRKNPKRRGEIGEISFLQRASQKGLRVSRPFGDSDAYDFIVDNWEAAVARAGESDVNAPLQRQLQH